MTRTTKLNDLQTILLSNASRREDGSLLPPAGSIADQQDRIRRTIPPLLRRRFIEEAPVGDAAKAWREEDETLFGVTITDAGRAAIGLSASLTAAAPSTGPATEDVQHRAPTTPRAGSKAAAVVTLLQREAGATIAELINATGWLPHTTRAALTGLRKKGHAVLREQRDGMTCYRIAQAAVSASAVQA